MNEKMLSALGTVSAAVAIIVFGWIWMFCRISVGPGEMAIVTSKTGDELPPGAILAEPGQKGVQRIPLAEGRHFLNPITHDWRIVRAFTIPAGSVGVVTSKSGKELEPGETLVARYSPGYGDFPLAAQGALVSLLDTPRKVGVSLTSTFLLTPSKSVTAVIGVRRSSAERKVDDA